VTVAAAVRSDSLWGVGSANMLLQGATLGSRALLLFGLALYLTPAELGEFGLLGVTLSLALYLVGLDFYAFNTRELLRGDLAAAPSRIRDQFVFHGITYLIAFPLLLTVFLWGVLPWSFAILFYSLLLMEHLAQELQRILITLHRSVHASALMFIRGGFWVFAVLGLMAMNPAFRSVETVVVAWTIGVAISLIGAAYYLRDLPWSRGTRASVDWAWIRRGLAVSLPFLVSTLAFRGVVSADRYALDHYAGTEAVGVFTLYVGIRNAIQSLLDMGVIAVLRPKVIQAYQTGEMSTYKTLMRQLTVAVTSLGAVLCLAGAIGIWPLLAVVRNPIYGQHLSAYWLILGMTLAWTLGDIPQTALYARNEDRAIVVANLTGLVIAAAANILLVPRYSVVGAALATFVALLVMAALKAAWAARLDLA
jgi:O-antigen/teichoic acid export membrane protein